MARFPSNSRRVLAFTRLIPAAQAIVDAALDARDAHAIPDRTAHRIVDIVLAAGRREGVRDA